MQLFNYKKFEKTELSKPIPPYVEKENLHKSRMWNALFKIYGFETNQMEEAQKDNPWAKLCQKIVLDVFPGFNRPKKRGRAEKRTDDRCIFIYKCYKSLTMLSNIQQAEAYHRIALYQSKKTGLPVKASDIANDVNKGRKLDKKLQENDPYYLVKIFTGGITLNELYTSKDVSDFLKHELSIIPSDWNLEGKKDERNMGAY